MTIDPEFEISQFEPSYCSGILVKNNFTMIGYLEFEILYSWSFMQTAQVKRLMG